MKKISAFNIIKIFLVTSLVFAYSGLLCYAQEQCIAESFGLCSKGIEYYRTGNLYEAKDALERAVKLDPRNNEANGYLDLVNAELRMRSKGKFGYYQKPDELEKERDGYNYAEEISDKSEYYENGNDYYEPEEDGTGFRYDPEEACEEYEYIEESDYEYDSSAIISGEARMAMGLTSKDVIWKDANSDDIGVPFEKNYNYLWGQDRHNTYDKKIYDRLMVDVDTNKDSGFNAYGQIVIDPWTFVGKQDVTIYSVAGHPLNGYDSADIELKYWSNTRSTINETYRSRKGNIVKLKEIKIIDGKTTANRPTGITDWTTNLTRVLTGTEIDWQYMPLRKLWVDYNKDDETFNSRLFLMANQDQALTSDDPLRLSNNHAYWEESPWLDEYEPSRMFYRDNLTLPLKKGRWTSSLSFLSKDSDYERLTFLRGLSINGDIFDSTSYNFTAATPMSLWDSYEDYNSVPVAFRTKTEVSPDLSVGSIYTFKGGVNQNDLEAQNHVLGFDGAYSFMYNWQIFGQIAASDTTVDEANGQKYSYDGFAYNLAFKNEPLNTKISMTYMDQDFFPGLSNYRYTRRDQFYSKHIRFSELPEADQEIAIGDGVDRGRVVLGVETVRNFLEEDLNTKLNFRNVHRDNGKYVETVGRAETTYNLSPSLTLKGLAIYQHLPKTKAGMDPLFYANNSYAATDYYSEEDVFMENDKVKDGEDPSIGNFGVGARYEFNENMAWEGVYEKTNDPNDCPRGFLNDSSVTTETKDGMFLDKVVPYLYSQGFFELPPYDYYDIYKTKLIFKPFTKLTGILSFTRNLNEHTIGLDDNVNHFGLEFDYKKNEKLTFGFKYIYSKMIDVYRQIVGDGVHYDGHHNIFAEIDYVIDSDQKFSLLFGEFVAYAPMEDLYAPAKWTLSSLDTQHIIRMFYNKKF